MITKLQQKILYLTYDINFLHRHGLKIILAKKLMTEFEYFLKIEQLKSERKMLRAELRRLNGSQDGNDYKFMKKFNRICTSEK